MVVIAGRPFAEGQQVVRQCGRGFQDALHGTEALWGYVGFLAPLGDHRDAAAAAKGNEYARPRRRWL
jgi:hypothetical protein